MSDVSEEVGWAGYEAYSRNPGLNGEPLPTGEVLLARDDGRVEVARWKAAGRAERRVELTAALRLAEAVRWQFYYLGQVPEARGAAAAVQALRGRFAEYEAPGRAPPEDSEAAWREVADALVRVSLRQDEGLSEEGQVAAMAEVLRQVEVLRQRAHAEGVRAGREEAVRAALQVGRQVRREVHPGPVGPSGDGSGVQATAYFVRGLARALGLEALLGPMREESGGAAPDSSR